MTARIIAHRGAANLWPENTLAAFARAIKLGVDGIEFDLQLSADEKLIIHHDMHLKADATRRDGVYLTPPTPKIADLTYDTLKLYDVGRLNPTSPYGQQRANQQPIDGEKIPEFSALCALVRDHAPPDFRLYAELKTAMDEDEDAVARLAQIFAREIEKSKLVEQCHIISFDWRAIAHIRAILPHIAHAYTTLSFATTDPNHASADNNKPNSVQAKIRHASANGAVWWGQHDWRNYNNATHSLTHGEKVLCAMAEAGARNWFAYWRDITPDMMAHAQKLGLEVSAWTVNQRDDKEKLEQLGVATIITDRPDTMLI